MNQIWIYTLASVFLVSLISLAGVLVIVFKREYFKKILLFFVSFAAGALLGDVFFHLFPELIEANGFSLATSFYILLGILIFFVLEKIIHWRHCHMAADEKHCKTHPLAIMNLVGDGVHNFIDGVLIAASYMLSIPVGIATTVAVLLHEIPQEMGDFGVLLHSGMKVKKALLYNFLIALSSVIGAVLVLIFGPNTELTIGIIIPITIGGFLYIANTDLIPELHKDVKPSNSFFQLLSLLAGITIMWSLLFLPGGHGVTEDTHETTPDTPPIHLELDKG